MMNPDMSIWTGRDDTPTEGPNALRWWQCVKPYTPDAEPGIVLIGFACDEGVRRNGGRVGAKDGPRALRKALANMAWHLNEPVYDAGDIHCDDQNMEAAQSQLAALVASTITAGHRPLSLGGGHETAWGTFQGIVKAKPDAKLGIINIDAHLDMRSAELPNSGTAFRQMADWCNKNRRPFHYLCIGLSNISNTVALTSDSYKRGVKYIPATDFARIAEMAQVSQRKRTFIERLQEILPSSKRRQADRSIEAFVNANCPITQIHNFKNEVDLIYLSVDLDVLPASVVPGVSSPAARGLPIETVERLLLQIVFDPILKHPMIAADIVELNPAFDPDGRSARTAAYLTTELVWHWNNKMPKAASHV